MSKSAVKDAIKKIANREGKGESYYDWLLE